MLCILQTKILHTVIGKKKKHTLSNKIKQMMETRIKKVMKMTMSKYSLEALLKKKDNYYG